MASDVSIANLALITLGGEQITSLDDKGRNATVVKASYADVRDAVLRDHPWNCATRRVKLPAEAQAPAFGFAHQFALPSDPYCLRVLELVDTSDRHVIEGRKILTDAAGPLKLLYIARIGEDEFDAALVQAMGYRLAAAIAPRIKDNSAADRAWSAYEKLLSVARSVDAMECSPPEEEESSFISARY